MSMFKVYWNNGKAQQLFTNLHEAKEKRRELLEDGEDNITISQMKDRCPHTPERDIIGKHNRY